MGDPEQGLMGSSASIIQKYLIDNKLWNALVLKRFLKFPAGFAIGSPSTPRDVCASDQIRVFSGHCRKYLQTYYSYSH